MVTVNVGFIYIISIISKYTDGSVFKFFEYEINFST